MLRKLCCVLQLLASTISIASAQGLTTPPDGGNKKASVSERIGITDVAIHYDRPGVKGREGKIWGQLVAYGFTDQGFGTSKAAPWRAGANENTTIEFSTDVKVEGQPLAAGKYALFLAMGQGDATVVFSKNNSSWGSYFYDPKEDALRVTVKTIPLNESVERLKYEFMDQTDNSATVNMIWEKLRVPFKVEVDYVKTQMESFARELRNNTGFKWEPWVDAANFALQNNGDLNQALQWSEYAVSAPFIGQKNFRTLSTKAAVLNKLGRTTEANALMKEAIPMGTMQDLQNYGRQLIREKKPKEALEIFVLNDQKNPGKFMTKMGLMRGYSANGDYKNALKYAREAHALAPDKPNKDAVEGMIKKLEEGKDVN